VAVVAVVAADGLATNQKSNNQPQVVLVATDYLASKKTTGGGDGGNRWPRWRWWQRMALLAKRK